MATSFERHLPLIAFANPLTYVTIFSYIFINVKRTSSSVGELEGRNKESTPAVGVQGQLTSFLPARTEPIQLGPLPPCLIVRQYQGDSDLKWLANAAQVETSLLISGSKPIPSFRVELGLTDASSDSLNNHMTTTRKKEFKAAVEVGDERRWVYTSNWKEWPAEITIKDNRRGDGNVGGPYSKFMCYCMCVLNV